MISTFIRLMEQGSLPDSLIRLGVRKLCRERLKEEHIDDCEKQSEQFTRLIHELKQSPLAVNTDDANRQHYEVPAPYFLHTLGKHLKYSCALWESYTLDLDVAEQDMLELYLQRAEISDGMHVLELGCGWGSLTLFMAERLPNSKITAVSNSHSQREYIESVAAERDLENVEVITQDINELQLDNTYDRIISIEMFEHIRNYAQIFERVASWLKPQGKLFLHIFCHRYLMYLFEDEGEANWMTRYFFSGGQMPSADTFLYFQDQLKLQERWLLSGTHYAKTSRAWLENMDARRDKIMPVFSQTYGQEQAAIWFQRWRVFYIACEELFAFNGGNEWLVGHYLFQKK